MNDQKEMKLLLDMYKGVSKEQRDKVQLMAMEKKLRSEIEDLRNQLKKMQVIYFLYFIIRNFDNTIRHIRKVNARSARSWPTRMLFVRLNNWRSKNTNSRSKLPTKNLSMVLGLDIIMHDPLSVHM